MTDKQRAQLDAWALEEQQLKTKTARLEYERAALELAALQQRLGVKAEKEK